MDSHGRDRDPTAEPVVPLAGVEGCEVMLYDVIGRDGTVGPGVRLTLVPRGIGRLEHRHTYALDLEMLRHLAALLPELATACQEEFHVRRARRMSNPTTGPD